MWYTSTRFIYSEESMNDISLKLDKRELSGKKIVKLRKDGIIPSVVYSDGKSIMTQSAQIDTAKVVQSAGRHTPVDLFIDGKKHLAIIKDIDTDPAKSQLRHVAFHLIKRNEAIVTEVPIVLSGKGESLAEKAGLIVLQALDHIEIKAKPADLPEALEVSILDLETTDDKLTLEKIKLPEGVEYADVDINKELVIANVYEPSALQAANEAAGGEAEEEKPEETASEGEAVENEPGDTDNKDSAKNGESEKSEDKK